MRLIIKAVRNLTETVCLLALAPGDPGVPGVPFCPAVPCVPGVPGVPALPGVPSAPGGPGVPGVPGVPGTPTLGVAALQRVGLTVTRGCSSKKAPCIILEGKRTHQVCRVILVRREFLESLQGNRLHHPPLPKLHYHVC